MTTSKRLLVFVSCGLSGIAALFSIISLATEEWVVTDSAMWVAQLDDSPNTIKYGLFEGTFRQKLPTDLTLQITMTCRVGDNVCAVLCAGNSAGRYNLLKQLYNNDVNATQDDSNCPAVRRVFRYKNREPSARTDQSSEKKKFINCGVWVSTILFLVVSLVFGLLASALSMYNIVSSPVQVYLSLLGIYVYNGIAMGCSILAMVLWGVMFIITTYHDIAIYHTLVGRMTSDKRASLGYSYWINIISVVFYCGSLVVFYIRQFLLSKDPKHKIVEIESTAEPGIYLY
ncbi:hypothetical protein JTB14_005899 [Gonioctena quinquepunctata]|nr:hypothetical protein JTB14_005899 [Gonioctena quinquepunctata]